MAGSIAIIGAGIAGLSAGCYGRVNGYTTRVFEMHNKPGGLCTSWKRDGYVFDGCIHWLVGSGGESGMGTVWKELGALEGKPVVNHEEFMRVELKDGGTLIVYTDADKLERHLKELSPADSGPIDELMNGIRLFSRIDMPIGKPPEVSGFLDRLKAAKGLLPVAWSLFRWGKKPVEVFARRFKDPFLREALPLVFDVEDFPMLGMITTLAWLNKKDAGYPVGGSLEFSRAIEKRYLELGGEISYSSKVSEIIVEDDRAVGVRLEDGAEHRADVVVSAADGHSTIFDMLKGRYVNDEIKGYYRDLPLFPALVQVSIGVARDLSNEPHSVSFPTSEPLVIGGQRIDRLTLRHYCYDPTLAPKGKSVVTLMIPNDYEYWKDFRRDDEGYRAEKESVADSILSELDNRYPGFRDDVEVVDVATPMTYIRYTGNWKASFEGWLLTTDTVRFMAKPMKRELPGLDRFFMIGQWVTPGGGLPPAAMSAREVLQVICHRDGREFTAG